jgi:ribonuclease-3
LIRVYLLSSKYYMENENPDLVILLESLAITDSEKINKELIITALTHKSTKVESKVESTDNERLEYLGDAVLKLAVSQWLYNNYPESSEGVMSQTRAYVVSDKTLARIARKINLGNYIILGKKEHVSGGKNKDSILANSLEALMGAVFVSTNYDTAAEMVIKLTETELKNAIKGDAEEENAKDLLQKITQARFKVLPEYHSSHLEGPPHKAVFQCIVKIQDKEYYGTGSSKKEAEQHAAKLALKDFKDEK